MTHPASSEDGNTEDKRPDVYMSFTSGAKFGIVVAILVLLVKSM